MTNKIYIYPTDTVWGIGGNIFELEVYEKICKIKAHDANKPMSVLFNSLELLTSYVELPPSFDLSFFKLETTLLVEISKLKKSIPSWIYQDSLYIGVRCLAYKHIDHMILMEGAPIITTSLNLSGEPPIEEDTDAKIFFKKYASNCVLVENSECHCSSHSSTIVKLTDSKYEIIRKGNRFIEVQNKINLHTA